MARKSRKNTDNAVIETVISTTIYKVAAYVRLSVEDNYKKGDSVETQKAILQNFITMASDMKLHCFYIDNGISGTTFERPAFIKMLTDVENGVINCIIVKDLSRFGRSAIDTGYYIEKYLPALGCRFISVNDDFDSNKDKEIGAGVILPLKNIINEAYAHDISRKIKAQKQEAIKSGDFIGSRPPYGYLKSPNNCHKLIVNPVTAPVVKYIYDLFISGDSMNKIVRSLNEAGIITPSHYQKELGLITHKNLIGCGTWLAPTIKNILANEVYVGNMVQGKNQSTCRKKSSVPKSDWIRILDTHEPIIDRDTFAKAQKRLNCIAVDAASRPKKSHTANIFIGKIFCGHCGGRLHRDRYKRVTMGDKYIFSCKTNIQKFHGSCKAYLITEDEIKKTLLVIIQSYVDVVIDKNIKIRKKLNSIESKRQEIKAEAATLRQKADRNRQMFKSLYESFVSGLITSDEYCIMRTDYEMKIKETLIMAAELESKQIECEKQVAQYFEQSELIISAEKNGISAMFIDKLINRIEIFSDKRIDVEFSFVNSFEWVDEVIEL